MNINWYIVYMYMYIYIYICRFLILVRAKCSLLEGVRLRDLCLQQPVGGPSAETHAYQRGLDSYQDPGPMDAQ